MIISFLLTLSLFIAPSHDFHTTLMNFTYQDDEKSFEIDLTVDTEHLEYILDQYADTTVRLGEDDEISNADQLINRYIRKHIKVEMNNKNFPLELDLKEVNFAETTLHFKSMKHKKKLKKVYMRNTFMINDFPNQKNLVKFNYKGESKSMLFDYKTAAMEVEI